MIAWEQAWDQALYGADGFYRREDPVDHFRTSTHVSPVFAAGVLELARRHAAGTIVDAGAGRGELLGALERLAPGEFALHGVDLRPRPDDLPESVAWSAAVPNSIDGLLIANELLDNIACPVVERDDAGAIRTVLVDPHDGRESLGEPVRDPALLAWLARWWPLSAPGERAEIGLARDVWWRDAVARVTSGGVAVAIDYGHLLADRPPYGSLRAYRAGGEVDVVPDGSCDVTAHVAVDALADAVGGTVSSQRDALRTLGVDGARPPLALATSDPTSYLRRLAAASEAAELIAHGGLGDFWWIVTEIA